MGIVFVIQHVMNACQEDYVNVVLAAEGTPNEWKQDGALHLLR